MPLTHNQEQAVKTYGRPLFIQAGAGTGKTFTLTKRIGYGLTPESGPQLNSIDNLLTITFTEKAAAELLGRVRGELRARGMGDAALKVDAAWISTIHGMCRRILAAHAFEAGFDPGQAMLSEEETSDLLDMSIDELLKDKAQDSGLSALIETLGPGKVCQYIHSLAADQLARIGDISALELGPAPAGNSSDVFADLFGTVRGVREELEAQGADSVDTGGKAAAKAFEKLVFLENALTDALESSDICSSWTELYGTLSDIPLVKGGSAKKPFRPLFAAVTEAQQNAVESARAAAAYEQVNWLLSYAMLARKEHEDAKRKRGVLDIGDLLTRAASLLKEHPDVADALRNQFNLVMVDEFQDTDSLQVDIISNLTDEKLSTLATVGDAQQSIYGFRGADLEVYRAMRSRMHACDSAEIKLDTNFRSHPAILELVQDIFSTPSFFGGEFLQVKPGPANARDHSWLAADAPHLRLLFSAGAKSDEGTPSETVMRHADAEALADAFAELASRGASYGDMAILMRSTGPTHSKPYLDALRKRGIPCVISGGSAFYTQPEVIALVQLLRVLENRDDDEAMLACLISPLFEVADDDLLLIKNQLGAGVHTAKNDPRRRASAWDSIRWCCSEKSDAAPGEALVHAFRVLNRAFERVDVITLSRIVRLVIEESGWQAGLELQGVEGQAVLANLLRFCDLVAEYEQMQGGTTLSCAEHFRAMVELAQNNAGARGKPGVMVSDGDDAVRIMTIHASKGLEFPIVAVAEFDNRNKSSRAPIVLTEDGVTHLVMNEKYDAPSEVSSFAVAKSALSYARYASELQKERELEEQQRLFYVALTRARDLLIIVAHDKTYVSKGKLSSSNAGDLFTMAAAQLWPDEEDSTTAVLPDNGSVVRLPSGELLEVAIENVAFRSEEDEPEENEESTSESRHPLPALSPLPPVVAAYATESPLYSYTSIAHRDERQPMSGYVPPSVPVKVDTANAVGSAFHLVAQWLAVHANADEGGVVRVDADALSSRISAAARRYGLDGGAVMRLWQMVDTWRASDRCKQAFRWGKCLAEHPFSIEVGGIALRGSIDLLCREEGREDVLVIDYKTGTSGEDGELRERYALQAACYCYALLKTGVASRVEMVFVRPEVGMQEVVFTYSVEDMPALEDIILQRNATAELTA